MKKLNIKTKLITLTLALGIFLIPTANAQQVPSLFPDVPTNYQYVAEINELKNRGIISGFTDGTFKPQNNISRFEFTKIVIGTKYSETDMNSCISAQTETNLFPDVTNDQLFAKWVCVAKRDSVVSGFTDGFFKGEENITYGQALKVLMRTLDDSTANSVPADSNLETYISIFSGKNVYNPGLVNDTVLTRDVVAYLTITIQDGYQMLSNSLADAQLFAYFSEKDTFLVGFNVPTIEATPSDYAYDPAFGTLYLNDSGEISFQLAVADLGTQTNELLTEAACNQFSINAQNESNELVQNGTITRTVSFNSDYELTDGVKACYIQVASEYTSSPGEIYYEERIVLETSANYRYQINTLTVDQNFLSTNGNIFGFIAK